MDDLVTWLRRIVETFEAIREAAEIHVDAFFVMKTVLRDLADSYGVTAAPETP